MGSLRFGDFADSPSMILSTQQHQHSFEPVSAYNSTVHQYHSFKAFKPIEPLPKPRFRFEKMANQQPPTGVKRKRDSFDGEPSNLVPQPEIGFPHILPSTEELLMASSSTPQVTEAGPSSSSAAAEPSRHKVPRRSTADTNSLTTTGPNNTIVSTAPNPITTSPQIDQLTQLLGIGWTAVITSPDPDFQKAVRGWEKYIDNHYPLFDIAIQARSKGLGNAFLVVARNHENVALRRWFLFREDLLIAKLIASDWDTALQRIASEAGPTGFDGFAGDILSAQRTPALTPTSCVSDEAAVQDLNPVTPSPVDSGVEDGMVDAVVGEDGGDGGDGMDLDS